MATVRHTFLLSSSSASIVLAHICFATNLMLSQCTNCTIVVPTRDSTPVLVWLLLAIKIVPTIPLIWSLLLCFNRVRVRESGLSGGSPLGKTEISKKLDEPFKILLDIVCRPLGIPQLVTSIFFPLLEPFNAISTAFC